MALGTGLSVLGDLFGKNNLEAVRYSTPLAESIDTLSKGIPTVAGNITDAYETLKGSVAKRLALAESLAKQAIGDYNQLYGQQITYNPEAMYGNLLGTKLSALQSWLPTLSGAMTRDQKNAAMSLGAGGVPLSSYTSNLLAKNLGQQMVPLLSNIFSTTGGDVGTLANARRGAWTAAGNTITSRNQMPFLGLGLEALPAETQLGLLGRLGQYTGGLADSARVNTSGWQAKPNFWARLGNAGNTIDTSEANMMSSIAQIAGAAGGGGGGGGGAGIGSIGALGGFAGI